MNLHLTRVDVWAAEIDDQPGGLAQTLRAIADKGADIDLVLARREPNKFGKGTVLVAPLRGTEADRATQNGFHRATEMTVLKVEGPNEAGMGAKLAKTIADAGVNLNNLTATVLGHRFVCYVGFDSATDREKAEVALSALSTREWRFWPRRSTTKIIDLEAGHTLTR